MTGYYIDFGLILIAYKELDMNDFHLGGIRSLPKLLKFQLAWHASVMKDILIKYKILAIFILLLIAPTIHALINFISLPAMAIVANNPAIST